MLLAGILLKMGGLCPAAAFNVHCCPQPTPSFAPLLVVFWGWSTINLRRPPSFAQRNLKRKIAYKSIATWLCA